MNYQKNIDALKNLKKPAAIIFDWDNTLVDTWPLIHDAINVTMRAMNKDEWTYKHVVDNVHKSMRESFPEIFGSNWQKAGEIYKNAYRSNHLVNLKLLNGALELIDKIKQKNILQMIVSNKIGATLRKEIKNLQIDDKFFSIIGSQDCSSDKPDIAPVLLALSGSGLELAKDHIWFVGDTIADINCAYNGKMQPIIYGQDNGISKTIASEIYLNGKNNEGAIPLYFKHQELSALIDKF